MSAWIFVIKEPLEKPDIVIESASAPRLGNLVFYYVFPKKEARLKSFVENIYELDNI